MYAYETSKYLNHQKVYRLAMRTRVNQKCASCGTRTVLMIISWSSKINLPDKIVDIVFQVSAGLGS
jgi:transcription elongation factor Elf1